MTSYYEDNVASQVETVSKIHNKVHQLTIKYDTEERGGFSAQWSNYGGWSFEAGAHTILHIVQRESSNYV